MCQLEWYSRNIKEDNCKDIGYDNLWGTKYLLSCNDETGYILYNDTRFRADSIAAFGKFGETELILKKEGTLYNQQLNIYNNKSNILIGSIGTRFIYKGLHLNYYAKNKSLFDKNYGFDLRFDIYTGDSNTILSMLIDRVNKKWYTNVYGAGIKGTIQLLEHPNWEFVICVFFYLHYYLLSVQHSG